MDLRKIPEDYRERAKDEAKILHDLNHRHLVHHVNSYIKHPYLCIITEFCAGGDMDKLVQHLAFRDGLPEKLIVVWLMQTASALDYMHTHSPVVLHRDLKPQNIYVTENGDLRLGDLGLARKLAGPMDMATSQVGTIVYLSPEILNQKPYNSKSDIWSLGCVFYDITGKKGNDEMGVMFLLVQVMGGRQLPLPDNYSPELRSIITSMLTKDPSRRPSAGNILASPLIQNYLVNPQRPVEIINEHARKLGRQNPRIARDLSDLRGAASVPIRSEDIMVPADAITMLADVDKDVPVARPRPKAKPYTVTRTQKEALPNPVQTVQGMSSNSMFLVGMTGPPPGAGAGYEASNDVAGDGAGGAAGGGDDETYYDLQTSPEMGEEHLLLQLQKIQSECAQGLGEIVLEAAYDVIKFGIKKDFNTFKAELKELLGNSNFENFGAKIVQMRALEMALYENDQSRRGSTRTT